MGNWRPDPGGLGMGISAEVKTGKRLLIEYLIAPLLRYKMDSVEER